MKFPCSLSYNPTSPRGKAENLIFGPWFISLPQQSKPQISCSASTAQQKYSSPLCLKSFVCPQGSPDWTLLIPLLSLKILSQFLPSHLYYSSLPFPVILLQDFACYGTIHLQEELFLPDTPRPKEIIGVVPILGLKVSRAGKRHRNWAVRNRRIPKVDERRCLREGFVWKAAFPWCLQLDFWNLLLRGLVTFE